MRPPLWGDSTYTTVGTAMQNPAWSAVIKLTQTISPNLLNETAFLYSGNKIGLSPIAGPGGSFVQPAGWSATSYFPTANNAGVGVVQYAGNIAWDQSDDRAINTLPITDPNNAANPYDLREGVSNGTLNANQYRIFPGFSSIQQEENETNSNYNSLQIGVRVENWFSASSFAAPVAPWNGGPNQGFGNAGKDAVVGPGLVNFNWSLFKNIPLKEGGPSLELRYDPRTLQLGGKFHF